MASPICGYHLTAKAVSFGKGQSAVHTAAYNARSKPLEHERESKQTNDYTKAGGLLLSFIMAPNEAKAWAQDRQELWNRAEASERQWNGQPARNVVVAFPHQLDQQQREWLIKDFVREQFVRKGMVADVNIHAPHPGRNERNFHAHILLTMRELDGEDFARTKNREWNRTETLERWRERWAEMGGRALERAGHQIEADRWRHGHKELPAQREAALERGDLEFAEAINREPTQHRGPNIDAMERKGMQTERGNIHRDTFDRAAELADWKAELVSIEREIALEQQRQAERMNAAETREMEEHGKRRVLNVGDRWIQGPQTGRMVEHHEWATEQAKYVHAVPGDDDHPARQQEERSRLEAASGGSSSSQKKQGNSEIDLDRFRADPDYRREITASLAQQRREQREQQRSNQEREPREREDRQR